MLGRELVSRLAADNRVIGTSKSGRGDSIACDLSRWEETRRLFSDRVDLVIHTAAYSDVDGCEKNPALAHESNAIATRHLAEPCGEKGIPLIYISTDYVFDGQKRTPYAETDSVCPVNIYGLTKLEGECCARQWASVSAVVRTSWLFGAGNPKNFVNAIAERLKNEKTVPVLDDQEDSPTYVGDLAEALERIGLYLMDEAKKKRTIRDVFHVCNAGSTTRYGMALKIKECLGLTGTRVEKIPANAIPGRVAVRPAYAVMSSSHYCRSFTTELRPWQDSLSEYLD